MSKIEGKYSYFIIKKLNIKKLDDSNEIVEFDNFLKNC